MACCVGGWLPDFGGHAYRTAVGALNKWKWGNSIMGHQLDPSRVNGIRDVRGVSTSETCYRFPRSKIPTMQVPGAGAGNISTVPDGSSGKPDIPASGANVRRNTSGYPAHSRPYIKRSVVFTAHQHKRVPGRILTFHERFYGHGSKGVVDH
jgi:hypothetical protein